MIYKIYAWGLHGYELVSYAYNDEQVNWCISQLDNDVYTRAIVIKHNVEVNQDMIYDMIELEEKIKRKKTRK